MDDRIAREGVIARCDLEPEASQNDIECANARRAAATIALREERERREEFERESERKLRALREQVERRELAAREAAAAAARAAQEAYEAQWENGGAGTVPTPAGVAATGDAGALAGQDTSAPSPGAEPAAPGAVAPNEARGREAAPAQLAGSERLREITLPQRRRLDPLR